ncbi:MAG: type II toxin-antitoxin system Phd/YefM family antitoxin [Oceanipulchritudo sp.]
MHPKVIEENGEKKFVILPYDEFLTLCERLEDSEDLRALRCAVAEEKAAPTLTLDQVKANLLAE